MALQAERMLWELSSVNELVECRSESEYAERPSALYWQGNRLEIEKILAGWRAPEGKHFWVVTENGLEFELCYHQAEDAWSILQR